MQLKIAGNREKRNRKKADDTLVRKWPVALRGKKDQRLNKSSMRKEIASEHEMQLSCSRALWMEENV